MKIIDGSYIISRTLNQNVITWIQANPGLFDKLYLQLEMNLKSLIDFSQFPVCNCEPVIPDDLKFFMFKMLESMIVGQSSGGATSCDSCNDAPNGMYVSQKKFGDVSVSYSEKSTSKNSATFLGMTINDDLARIISKYTEKTPLAGFFTIGSCY